MNRLSRLISVMLLGLLAVSCEHENAKKPGNSSSPLSPPESTGEGKGTINVQVSFAPKNGAAKPSAVEAIDKVTAYLYTASMPMRPRKELACQDLSLVNGRAQGTIEVAAQDDMRLVLVCYFGDTVRYMGDDTDVSVTAGQETQALIFLEYQGIELVFPTAANAGEAYTLSSQATTFASVYELWEGQSPDYSDAVLIDGQIYPYFTVPAKESSGTYYYRVRVTTEYGPGPWTWGGQGVVRIDGGTIGIDFVMPEGDMGFSMVSIPGGSFQMGDETGYHADAPLHYVTVSGFEMNAYEITNAQYAQFLNEARMEVPIFYLNMIDEGIVRGKNGQYPESEYLWPGYSMIAYYDSECFISYDGDYYVVEPGKENWPVVGVTWYGAKAFANYYGMDLPTEAEWEYACRGGYSQIYGTCDGEFRALNANIKDDLYYHPIEVGHYPPNPFGLYDMCGNVYEYCHDGWGSYEMTPQTDPVGNPSSDRRIMRGGHFHSDEHECLSSSRAITYMETAYVFTGFRVVRRPGGLMY